MSQISKMLDKHDRGLPLNSVDMLAAQAEHDTIMDVNRQLMSGLMGALDSLHDISQQFGNEQMCEKIRALQFDLALTQQELEAME